MLSKIGEKKKKKRKKILCNMMNIVQFYGRKIPSIIIDRCKEFYVVWPKNGPNSTSNSTFPVNDIGVAWTYLS